MPVRHVPCGQPVNQSERDAVEKLRAKLQPLSGDWVMLSNLQHSQGDGRTSSEIDLLVIGPPGVVVIEVKHWDLSYAKSSHVREQVESEADRVNTKAKRIAGQLRNAGLNPGRVDARFLFTKPGTGVLGGNRFSIRGISVFGLTEWKELLETDGVASGWTPADIERAARQIEPRVRIATAADLRRFGELVALERIPTHSEPFHRIYRGQHPRRRDRIILHLFDLSASDDKNALERAKREFDVVQQWQKSPFVPSLLDSFQEADQYPGEIYHFSLLDSEAPSIVARAKDQTWSFDDRLRFAREALLALKEFHSPSEPELSPLLHRAISPATLKVKANGRPLFTGFEFARIVGADTVSPGSPLPIGDYVAPEVKVGGLSVADARSDAYSLCKTLQCLFSPSEGKDSEAIQWLELGCAEQPSDREGLAEIAKVLERNTAPTSTAAVTAALPASEYWDEDTLVPFKDSTYRVLSRLGRGGIGQALKVVEIGAEGEEFGTYVAKLIRNKADAERALIAYKKARQFTTHQHFSAIHEIASEWQQDRFSALLKWIDGTPLSDLAGVVGLRAEELGESNPEDIVLRWLEQLCDALWQFHEAGIVHGDVSPRNIIEQRGSVVLTDYDAVTKFGEPLHIKNPIYAGSEVMQDAGVKPSDDIYALAASFFHVVFDREPFLHRTERRKELGLAWDGIDAVGWPRLANFLNRATHPDPAQRFANANDALKALRNQQGEAQIVAEPIELTRQVAPRLRQLLSAYPGSRHGNAETRGLDSTFAEETYVETALDRELQQQIERGEADLVVLFGNAGDGKTAFLQRLTQTLTGSHIESKRRVWEGKTRNGRKFSINLDGSAAYQGKSANVLLDEFLRPYHVVGGKEGRNFTRALAINSGKMLEWLEDRQEDTDFTSYLRQSLFSEGSAAESAADHSRLRLVDLNQRSLVGGYSVDRSEQASGFLDSLIERFLGTESGANDPWRNCTHCSAQSRCSAWESVRQLQDAEQGKRLRARLTDALQAAHMRGEIHITARELRGALVFIFFGLHDCEELHDNPELQPPFYWNRAFAASGEEAEGRQGELLAELARLDPALDADPILDRNLLKDLPRDQRGMPKELASERRRAYFMAEDTAPGIRASGPPPLHGAKHLDRFRRVPGMSDAEREALCQDLCDGIARLEDLPDLAYGLNGLPLRVTPRTPTESCFWVLKPYARFSLSAPLPNVVHGLDVLHTQLRLTYRNEGHIEHLPIGLELFHLLLELKDGAQLSSAAQEGVFAHLDLFVQRVTQEDVRELYAWHPEHDGRVSRLHLEVRGDEQVLVHQAATEGGRA